MADTGGRGDADVQSKKLVRYAERVKHLTVRYGPYGGFVGAELFSSNFMAPLIFERAIGNRSLLLQNSLFTLAHLGTGLYIYDNLPGKDKLGMPKSLLVSAVGSILFNYGSLLLLANSKNYLPESHQAMRLLIGAGIVASLFWIGREYTVHVSSLSNSSD